MLPLLLLDIVLKTMYCIFCTKKKRGMFMKTFQYIVVDIDGDYAHLKRIDEESDELKLVARALLPAEITEGTKLLYEWMTYSVME